MDIRNRIKEHKILKRLFHYILANLNKINLQSKLLVMQILCVILPLILTDAIIIGIAVSGEKQLMLQDMSNTASSVKYVITEYVSSAALLAHNIYSNRYVNDFIMKTFESNLDYYNSQLDFIKDSLYPVSRSVGFNGAVIYADNKGIVNGGYFKQLNQVEEKGWYKRLMEGSNDIIVDVEYSQKGNVYTKNFFLAHKMDYYNKGKSKDVLRLELDYSAIVRQIINANYNSKVYVCDGDTILFSNDGKGGIQTPFAFFQLDTSEKEIVTAALQLYDSEYIIYVLPPEVTALDKVMDYFQLILLLIAFNIVLPYVLMKLISKSIIQRISELRNVFGAVKEDELILIPEINGSDEISELMESYNIMAARMNGLIQTVFKNKLYQQEMNIARQKAELLALRSQINPHFLFNALESIRMHSVLKHEDETADMVEKLALMHRQNVEWGRDLVTIREETSFIKAYLDLQKYRFGNKLSYVIDIEDECMSYRVPKLTLVTFVENACVHGIENKPSTGWIFLRGKYEKENKRVVFEIEDTGNGMAEDRCLKLQEMMNNVQIDMIKESIHVGILNAALRLKMAVNNHVAFMVESEENVGTIVTIKMSDVTAI